MKDERYLTLITVMMVVALHGALILAVWHTSPPQITITAPVMSFVDLDSLDLGDGAKSDHPEPAGAPAPVPAAPKPQIKPVDKPAIKPVIKSTSKPDIVQKPIEKPQVIKQPIVRETPEKVLNPSNKAADKAAQHMAANGSGSGSGSGKGNSSGSGGGSGHDSGSGAGGGSGSGGATTQPTYKASYLNNPKPPYPAMSRENGEEGTVVLSVTVEASGLASKVAISRSSGYPRLDHSAQTAVAKYRFKPATRGGVAISYTYAVPINFSLR